MKHPTKEEWHTYITRTLSPVEYERYETHLSSCDDCLIVYMRCIEEQSGHLPLLDDGAAFTEKVMKTVRKKKFSSPRLPFYRRTLFHYGTAAVLTLVLLTSGTFQGILSVVSNVETRAAAEEKSSLSDQLMHQAGHVLDSLDPTTRRDRHE